MAASELPAETLDLLLVYKVVLFSLVIPRCLAANRLIFSSSGRIFTSSFVPVSRLTAPLPATHLHSHLSSFFPRELLSETATFIITASYVSWKPFLGEWLVPVDECWLIAGVRRSVLYHLSHL